jgi:hypothetical protein
MDEPSSNGHDRHRRFAILCGAALAAAVFTPVPATAFAAVQPLRPAASIASIASNVHTVAHTTDQPQRNLLAGALITTGVAGLLLAAGGLVIVAVRRRQY